MAEVTRWVKVGVAMQTVLAAAQTITGISKASPAVVTHSGTDPTNGDYVLITAEGMDQVNARVFRVSNVNAGSDTFELEGEDSTLFDTFTSGSFQVITFGASFSTILGLQGSGGDFNMVDVTTIHDNVRKEVPGFANPITYSADSLWDLSDGALAACKAASDNQALRAFRLTFANSKKTLFNGYVGFTGMPLGNAGDKVTCPLQITMFGRPTHYAT